MLVRGWGETGTFTAQSGSANRCVNGWSRQLVGKGVRVRGHLLGWMEIAVEHGICLESDNLSIWIISVFVFLDEHTAVDKIACFNHSIKT